MSGQTFAIVRKALIAIAITFLINVGIMLQQVHKDDTNVLLDKNLKKLNAMRQFTSPPLQLANYSFSFSACLLIRDDNRILPEWLAYHYTVMPLRHLIVAVDPHSVTSPEPILDKYRELGMDITVWGDNDYFCNCTSDETYRNYLRRQRLFYKHCLMEFKNRGNHTWTMMVDTDEYIVFNYYSQSNMSLVPKIGSMTVANFISNQNNDNNTSIWEIFPCIYMSRVPFGAKESMAEQIALQVPDGFHPISFTTMRHRYRQKKMHPLMGKSNVDAARFDDRLPRGPHAIMQESCIEDSTLHVHHYTGPLELFLRYGETWRGIENFDSRNSFILDNNSFTDDSIRGWLTAFVDIVGREKAFEVTEGLTKWAFEDHAHALKALRSNDTQSFNHSTAQRSSTRSKESNTALSKLKNRKRVKRKKKKAY